MDPNTTSRHFVIMQEIEKYLTDAQSNRATAYSHLAGNGAVAALEAKLCSLYGAKYALCVSSATNGLMFLLIAAGLQRCEILTTPLSFGGTIAGALALDCKFHFAEIDCSSLNLNVDSIANILDENPQIKAVFATEFAGNRYDMKTLHQICGQRGVWHFVDSAQSLGYNYGISNIADYNDALVVSFGTGKTICAGGEGGAIITNNPELYQKLVSICQHPHRQERDCGIGFSSELTLNGRIHPIAAIIANETFESGLQELEQKRKVMSNALDCLSRLDSVSCILNQNGGTFYHCQFIIKDKKCFENEFSESSLSENYYYTKAYFVSIPEQLIRIGAEQRIKFYDGTKLKKLLKKLYLLHPKN